jgi:hypothetical protein
MTCAYPDVTHTETKVTITNLNDSGGVKKAARPNGYQY